MKQSLFLAVLLIAAPAFAGTCDEVPATVSDVARVQAAAAAGQVPAQTQLGYAYWVGTGLPQNRDKALFWLKRAARSNSGAAQYWLGRIYSDGAPTDRTLGEAAAWFSRAAKQDCAAARFYLGSLKLAGRGVPKNAAEGFRDLLKAANLGDVPAQVMVSALYAAGEGTAKDEKAAFEWMKKAADSGDSKAQISMANYYLLGTGTAPDPAGAQRLLRAVYDKGDDQRALAAYFLGWMYMEGKGVHQDDVQAFTWMIVAADAGVEDSAVRRKTLEQRLPKRKLARACAIHMSPDLSDPAQGNATTDDAVILLPSASAAAEAYFVDRPMVGFIAQDCVAGPAGQ